MTTLYVPLIGVDPSGSRTLVDDDLIRILKDRKKVDRCMWDS